MPLLLVTKLVKFWQLDMVVMCDSWNEKFSNPKCQKRTILFCASSSPPPFKKRENIGHTKNRVDIKLAKKSTKDTHIASGIAQQEKWNNVKQILNSAFLSVLI